MIQAKSVILCTGGKTGRLSRESTGSVRFNLHLPGNLSADGKAMALSAGLPIMNMEFLGARRYGLANYETAGRPPRNTWQPAARIVNAAGKTIVAKTTFPLWGDLENGYRIDAEKRRSQWLSSGGITPQGMPSRRDLATWQDRSISIVPRGQRMKSNMWNGHSAMKANATSSCGI